MRLAAIHTYPVKGCHRVDNYPVSTVHGTVVAATPAGDAADDWLTAVLDRKVRLVWLDDPTRRSVNPEYALPTDRVSFADACPLLLTNTASLAIGDPVELVP